MQLVSACPTQYDELAAFEEFVSEAKLKSFLLEKKKLIQEKRHLEREMRNIAEKHQKQNSFLEASKWDDMNCLKAMLEFIVTSINSKTKT